MIPAHDSPLAALAFDSSGAKLATASEKVGALHRVGASSVFSPAFPPCRPPVLRVRDMTTGQWCPFERFVYTELVFRNFLQLELSKCVSPQAARGVQSILRAKWSVLALSPLQ